MCNFFLPLLFTFGRSKIMSAKNLENLHVYGIFALAKVFSSTIEMEHSPLNISFRWFDFLCDRKIIRALKNLRKYQKVTIETKEWLYDDNYHPTQMDQLVSQSQFYSLSQHRFHLFTLLLNWFWIYGLFVLFVFLINTNGFALILEMMFAAMLSESFQK